MNIYIYERPSGDMLIVRNLEVYNYMLNKSIEEFSFGVLMAINDYEWHHGSGQGSLIKVYSDFEEARKHYEVYPCDLEDIEYARSDKPVKITIQKQEQANMIKISVDSDNEPIFDILHPDEINRIIPIEKDK